MVKRKLDLHSATHLFGIYSHVRACTNESVESSSLRDSRNSVLDMTNLILEGVR